MKRILETERLQLRELAPTDLGFLVDLLGNEDVMRFYPGPLTRDESRAWLDRQMERYRRDGFGFWLAVERETGRSVGQAGLIRQEIDEVDEVGLGYLLHRSFWGRGYATEAAAGCLCYASDVLKRTRVVCPVRPENVPSLRVAFRLGLRPEKHTHYAGYDHLILVT